MPNPPLLSQNGTSEDDIIFAASTGSGGMTILAGQSSGSFGINNTDGIGSGVALMLLDTEAATPLPTPAPTVAATPSPTVATTPSPTPAPVPTPSPLFSSSPLPAFSPTSPLPSSSSESGWLTVVAVVIPVLALMLLVFLACFRRRKSCSKHSEGDPGCGLKRSHSQGGQNRGVGYFLGWNSTATSLTHPSVASDAVRDAEIDLSFPSGHSGAGNGTPAYGGPSAISNASARCSGSESRSGEGDGDNLNPDSSRLHPAPGVGYAMYQAVLELADKSSAPGVSEAAGLLRILVDMVMTHGENDAAAQWALGWCQSMMALLPTAIKLSMKVSSVSSREIAKKPGPADGLVVAETGRSVPCLQNVESEALF